MNKKDRDWVLAVVDAKFRQYELTRFAVVATRPVDAFVNNNELVAENFTLRMALAEKKNVKRRSKR